MAVRSRPDCDWVSGLDFDVQPSAVFVANDAHNCPVRLPTVVWQMDPIRPDWRETPVTYRAETAAVEIEVRRDSDWVVAALGARDAVAELEQTWADWPFRDAGSWAPD